MPSGKREDVVYRLFYDLENHCTKTDDGRLRLQSGLLRGDDQSVWDGAVIDPEDVAHAAGITVPCGVLRVHKKAISDNRGGIEVVAGDPDAIRGHRRISPEIPGSKGSGRVLRRSIIVIQMPGHEDIFIENQEEER